VKIWYPMSGRTFLENVTRTLQRSERIRSRSWSVDTREERVSVDEVGKDTATPERLKQPEQAAALTQLTARSKLEKKILIDGGFDERV